MFCIDRFDQNYALEAYEKRPEVFAELEGFTAFDDNISLYGHTFPGVANLLTEKRFDSKTSRAEFLDNAYEQNGTLNVLNQNGYKINLFTQTYYAFSDATNLPDYVSNVSEAKTFYVEQKGKLALSMMQIALYRCFPLALKSFLSTVNSGTCNNYVVSESVDGYSQYSIDTKDVYQSVKGNVQTIEQKLFSFIHVSGCHAVDYNEEWGKPSAKERKDIVISLVNSFKIINVYLDAMKTAGVYEDATIIITGDHSAPIDDTTALKQTSLTALFFKPSGVGSGELKRSKAQVSHDNVWSTIFESENIASVGLKKSLFEVSETENTEREHVWHTYRAPMDEFVYQINGVGNDFSNWKLTNTNTYEKFLMD